jgi:hypothetical protein
MFTYNANLVEDKDQVRFLVQDTDPLRALFQDTEIDWVLEEEQNVYMAAARLCDIIIIRARDIKRKRVGDLDIIYDVDKYLTMANQFRARGLTYQMPFAGGISVSDKLVTSENSDAVQPSIVRNLDDNPLAPDPERPPINPLTTI